MMSIWEMADNTFYTRLNTLIFQPLIKKHKKITGLTFDS